MTFLYGTLVVINSLCSISDSATFYQCKKKGKVIRLDGEDRRIVDLDCGSGPLRHHESFPLACLKEKKEEESK